MVRRKFCVIVPAYNEEKVISVSLRSLKEVFKKEDIFVVNDGSTDQTARLAKKEGVNVVNLRRNFGKALAQEQVIWRRNLIRRYRYILFADADSCLDNNFLNEVEPYLSKKPALILGTVKSDRRGLISAFRTFEYGLSHRVYKSAQNIMRIITVAPGCASLYSSNAIKKLNLRSPTLTEDFDLTIQIHQKKLGEIIYVPKAVVTTQDPITLRDYWRQILRWNTGTWQNYFQYKLYRKGAKLSLELHFLFLDNFLWLISVAIAAFYPHAFLNILGAMFISVYAFALVIAVLERKFWIIPYIFVFPLFYFINIFAYYFSIFRALVLKGRKSNFQWQKVSRYTVT